MAKQQYIYAMQFGYCFKLTLNQWKTVCIDGAKGGYELPATAMLKQIPRFIRKPADSSSYWLDTNDKRVVNPLKMDEEDFKEELKLKAEFIK